MIATCCIPFSEASLSGNSPYVNSKMANCRGYDSIACSIVYSCGSKLLINRASTKCRQQSCSGTRDIRVA